MISVAMRELVEGDTGIDVEVHRLGERHQLDCDLSDRVVERVVFLRRDARHSRGDVAIRD